MPRWERVKLFLEGFAKFVALVAVAGAVGVALGMALSAVSGDNDTAVAPDGGAGTTSAVAANAPATATETAAALPPPGTTAPAVTGTAPSTSTATATTTTPSAAPNRFAQVRVDVLDARLHTDDAPSGRQPQPARVTVRVRADNTGTRRVTLASPTLRIGSVRVPVDRGADAARFGPLAGGGTQTVTLRFVLGGEATPKLVRDRRARILIAGRSLAIRIRVRKPS